MSLQNAFASWKSTVSSILTTTLATSAAFLAPPLNSLIAPKHVLWLGAFQVVGKIWIGAIQKDPDTVLAKVPGIAEPQVVAAHAIPDDPKAVPVVDK
jgi:hypothetical protein